MVGVLAFIAVKALMPETKGRSLEEIEADLKRKAHQHEPERDRALAGTR